MHSSPRRCFSPCTMPQSSSLERFCLANSRLRPMATAQSEEAGGGSASASDALAPTSVVPVGNSSLHPHRDVLFCDSVGPERMVLTHVLTLERFDLPPGTWATAYDDDGYACFASEGSGQVLFAEENEEAVVVSR